jgi:hypothetical protein
MLGASFIKLLGPLLDPALGRPPALRALLALTSR